MEGAGEGSMPRYVAFLGSINVGGNRLKMAELRDALEAEGFENVGTLVASGNVLFEHAKAADPKLESEIAKVIAERFGIETFAAVRSKAELALAIAENPFADEGDEKFVHTLFLEKQPGKADFARLEKDHEGRGNERMAAGTKALHLDYVDGVARSKLTGDFIARRLGCRGTARNLRSMKRILEKMD
jgi:uncharacterized protein (DUF1697 family)